VVKTLSTDAPLTALAFHNDGHTIAVGTLYGGLYIYDLKASGSPKLQLAGHDSQINFVDFIRTEQKEQKDISRVLNNRILTIELYRRHQLQWLKKTK